MGGDERRVVNPLSFYYSRMIIVSSSSENLEIKSRVRFTPKVFKVAAGRFKLIESRSKPGIIFRVEKFRF